MLQVADIMTREPHTLGPDNSLEEARRLMADHHIRHIPIVGSGGEVIGLVSHRDVLAASVSSLAPAGKAAAQVNGSSLAAIMSSPAQTVDESASLRGVALHLQQHKLGCLPVVRDHKLCGIVTDADFVAVAIHLMEQVEATEPEEDFFDESIDTDRLID